MTAPKNQKKWWIAVVFVALCAVALGVALILSAGHGNTAGPGLRAEPAKTVTDEKAVPPTPVAQPPTASEVAKNLGCGDFTSTDPRGSIGGTVTAGHCWLNGKKYAINTFASTAARDDWLAMTEQFGVIPQWETPTAVIYPSVTG